MDEQVSRIIDMLRGARQQDRTTFAEHYGMKEQEYDILVKQMMCDLIMHDDITVVLDKWFSECTPEQKCKVSAFFAARIVIDKVENI